jgi:hypothetical protein
MMNDMYGIDKLSRTFSTFLLIVLFVNQGVALASILHPFGVERKRNINIKTNNKGLQMNFKTLRRFKAYEPWRYNLEFILLW